MFYIQLNRLKANKHFFYPDLKAESIFGFSVYYHLLASISVMIEFEMFVICSLSFFCVVQEEIVCHVDQIKSVTNCKLSTVDFVTNIYTLLSLMLKVNPYFVFCSFPNNPTAAVAFSNFKFISVSSILLLAIKSISSFYVQSWLCCKKIVSVNLTLLLRTAK